MVDHSPQVYTVTAVTQEAAGAGESVTYADLDPRAFMVPHNKVLPTQQQQSSSDSRLELQTNLREDYCFTIMEKAPTRTFSWLKAPTSTFTFKTLLRHYAKWT